jgi:hypothetical protein
MAGRLVTLALGAFLALTGVARADVFSLQHSHDGIVDADASGDVTFPDGGGAVVNITVTDRAQDGWCGDAWVTTNLNNETKYQVCNVATSRSYTLNVPGGARCNVTFVNIQVGRVDPSNGNKTELGPAQRIANPCPPVAPPPPPPPVGAKVKYTFSANRHYTVTTGLSVSFVPAGATVALHCSHGCPHLRRVAVHNGRANVYRLLRHRRLRPGTTLQVGVTAPGMVGTVWSFKVRRGVLPRFTTRCLAPGAGTPSRC